MTGGTINPGYLLGQLARALTTSQQHRDAATRERAQARVDRWKAAIEGMARSTLTFGSRTPVAGLPAWVTLEVLRGGFATGNAAAGGELQPHEITLLDELGLPHDGAARSALNVYFLGDEGRARLRAMLSEGTYRLQLPEEGALLVVAWLLDQGHASQAIETLEPLIPFLDRLRFYPIPEAIPRSQGVVVHLLTVGELLAEMTMPALPDASEARGQIGAMNESMRHWGPLSDRAVALWLETVEGEPPAVKLDEKGQPLRHKDGNPVVTGGWPGARLPLGWPSRALALAREYEQLRARNKLSGRPERPRESFSRLRGYLVRAGRGDQLERRDWAAIRALLAGILHKRGAPGSERLAQIREAQRAQYTMPSFWVLNHVMTSRLAALPQQQALASIDPLMAPVNEAEAARFDLPVGAAMPDYLREKLVRCLDAPVEELVAAGAITSGEVLARVLPQITAQVQSASLSDPAARRLYGALYGAFRRRRSVLLLTLEDQVQIKELPWVAVLNTFRKQGLNAVQQARQTLEQVTTLALTSFPEEIFPNKLLQEQRALVATAGLDAPLVDELAADLFRGQLTERFVESARIAARMLRGTLYERYYGLPFDQILKLKGASAPAALVQICSDLAHADRNPRWSVALNGTIIEQQQLLTTQNLAALFPTLDLRTSLGPQLPELAQRCFTWVCQRLQRPVDGWHTRLIVLKNTAYAWRQMLFYLSLCSTDAQYVFLSWATGQMADEDEVFRLCFHPAFEGLRHAINGGQFDTKGRYNKARRFLGWTTERHWLG